jgi:hypothetical protein
MGWAYAIQHHPHPLCNWIRGHQWLARASLGLMIAILTVATAGPTVSVVRDAIAEQIEPLAKEAEVIPAAALPREWRWSIDPITFDHMYRQSAPHAVMDYVRDVRRKHHSSSSE